MILEDKPTSILSTILKLAANQAATILQEEFKLQWNVEKEIENLNDKLILIQAFLDDAERKQHRKDVGVWVENLQDVAYDAEDVLDEVATEASRLKLMGARKDWIRQVSDFFLSCFTCSITSSFLFRRGIAIRIKQIRENLDKIVKNGRDMGIQESMACQNQPDDAGPERETGPFPVELDVVGRTEEIKNLVHWLLSSGSDDATASGLNFSAISVSGMGGLGKTTLAQVVYNHPDVTGHFDRRIWAHVSHRLNVSRLIKNMIETATGFRPPVETKQALQGKLAEILTNRRFLIVLDDVWDKQQYLWEVLLPPLNCGLRGSKVIMTTRNERAAGTLVPTTPIKLGVMSNHDCWSIFKKHALAGASPGDRDQLEMMRKKIVTKAKGVPLAAKALGGLAMSIRLSKERRWGDLLKKEPEEDGENIISVLRLSYQQLPPPLKQCFAYCAVFPKGYVFSKTWLIQIWMALGFIQVRGTERMEDMGSDYFEALLSRSFFQSSQEGGFMMHDFMHNLAQTVSRDGFFRQEHNSSLPSSGKVRHLSLSTVNPKLLVSLHQLPKLRSLIFLNQDESLSVHDLQILFKLLRNLRVLHLSRIAKPSNPAHGFWSRIFPAHLCGICSNNFPDSICSLIHLRYLRIVANNVVRLPESLSKLFNLQNLRLDDSWKLRTLPNGVTNLVNLRHLEVEADDKVYEIAAIGKLTSLQKLKKFSIGREIGRGIGELKDLNELQETLSISGLENVASGMEAREAKLHEKHDIDVLRLEWCSRSIGMIDSKLDEEILEGLRPPTDLKELTITNYGGTRSPQWMLDQSLVGLEIVHLVGCPKWKVLAPLGQLPFISILRKLTVVNCQNLKQLPLLPPTLLELKLSEVGLSVLPDISDYHGLQRSTDRSAAAAALSFLEISGCPYLKSLHEGLLTKNLKALKKLIIHDCVHLESLSREGFQGLVSLTYLDISDCPELRQLPPLPLTLKYFGLSKVGLQALPGFWVFDETRSSSSSSSSLSGPSLSQLEISECHELTSLCPGLLGQDLRSLEEVFICCCSRLASLPGFRGFNSLRLLTVAHCANLASLPWDALPVSLKTLEIDNCPLLMDQYQEWGCEYWANISSPQIEEHNGRWRRQKGTLRTVVEIVIKNIRENRGIHEL